VATGRGKGGRILSRSRRESKAPGPFRDAPRYPDAEPAQQRYRLTNFVRGAAGE